MISDARAIANLILDRFDSARFSISNKKINKLLFFSHGFSLSWLGVPLIRNHFEAWTNGPVVKVVYDSFKDYDFRPITGRALSMDYSSGELVVVEYSALPRNQIDLVVQVCEHFCSKSADELEALTHEEGSPWWQIWTLPEDERGLRNRIPDPLIQGYFSKRWGQSSSTH
jgi:uncharacterized phage-associated protein